MVIFDRLFTLFSRNKPHRHLLKLYSKMNEISDTLSAELAALRKIQQKYVENRVMFARGHPTGAIGLSKTEFVEEELVPRLRKLSEETQERFEQVAEETKSTQPYSAEEEIEIRKILNFLEEIKKESKDIMEITNMQTQDKIRFIEDRLRSVEKECKQFYEIKKAEKRLIKKVLEHEIKPLVKKIFENAKKNNGITWIHQRQIKVLCKESEKLDRFGDKNFRIIWRKWYKKKQMPEIDFTPITITGKKIGRDITPHINATFIYNGEKQDIHLCVQKYRKAA